MLSLSSIGDPNSSKPITAGLQLSRALHLLPLPRCPATPSTQTAPSPEILMPSTPSISALSSAEDLYPPPPRVQSEPSPPCLQIFPCSTVVLIDQACAHCLGSMPRSHNLNHGVESVPPCLCPRRQSFMSRPLPIAAGLRTAYPLGVATSSRAQPCRRCHKPSTVPRSSARPVPLIIPAANELPATAVINSSSPLLLLTSCDTMPCISAQMR
ncbi:hypothetical protein M0R45_037447 [Rubus argutus]|uniref:Uncharacterized protein n=1 Tax=Rubus argutus TaxID=59490 RepID=A0AAW1W048_RUBAR